jgi:membrane protein
MARASAGDRNDRASRELPGEGRSRDDHVSGRRADYAPAGADPKPTTGGTFKRMIKEVGQDKLTDWAAALTYYGVLALFPAVIALVSLLGLLFSPAQITNALSTLLEQISPGTSAQSFTGVIEQIAGNSTAAGLGLVLGLAGALFSASGYVGAFTRAANVIWETPEGRPIWKLKPLQILITLIGVVLAAVLIGMVLVSGPVTEAIGNALGISSVLQTVWSIAKWPVMAVIVAIMIALLYYMTPNVRLRGFKWVSPGAGFAILVFAVASALFAFYVANVGKYNATYGALAGVVIFLIWFWLTNLSLLIGAELDSEIERTKELKEGVPRAEKEIQLDARQDPKPQQTT